MGKQFPQSFIDNEKLRRVDTLEELQSIIEKSCYIDKKGRKRKHLKDLDLSNVDVSKVRRDFDGWEIENVVFSRIQQDTPEKKTIFGLSFVGAHLHKVSFVQACLVRCNFDTKDSDAIKKNISKIAPTDALKSDEQSCQTSCDTTTNTETSSKHSEVPEFKDYYKVIWKPDSDSPTKMEEVDFFMSELDMCRFRNTCAIAVDFRYSHVRDCSMSESKFWGSDFYFCSFQGATNFIDSEFVLCSFTNSVFENNCIRMQNIPSGILQENCEAYTYVISEFPTWIRLNPCLNFSSLNHEESKGNKKLSKKYLKRESAEFYKQMSGMYAGKGLNRDSNKAYKKSKQNERKYHCYEMRESIKEKAVKRSIKNFFILSKDWATASFGYGYRWQAAVVWFAILILVYGGIYYFATEFKFGGFASWGLPKKIEEALSYSFNNSLGPFNELAEIVGLLLASCQTAFGMLLMGFLGFIIANNIRNDS